MKNNIYYKGFPNNLRIARRKVDNDETQQMIYTLLSKVKISKQEQNNYLAEFLSKSKLIGKL
jgi:hypothetical protein